MPLVDVPIACHCRGSQNSFSLREENVLDETVYGLHRVSRHRIRFAQCVVDGLTELFLNCARRRELRARSKVYVPVPPVLALPANNWFLIPKIPAITFDVDFSVLHGSSSV